MDVFASPASLANALYCALGGALITLICYYQSISMPRGPLTYIFNSYQRYKFLLFGPQIILDKYQKANGAAFDVSTPDHDIVFLSSRQHIKECQKAKEDELSFFSAARQMFQPQFTMLGHNWFDERGIEGTGYVKAISSLLPERIIGIMPSMRTVIKNSFDSSLTRVLTINNGKSLAAPPVLKKVMCDLNGHVFFGDELAKNKYFMASILEYNELVLTSAEVLRLTPDFLKPLVGKFFRDRRGVQARVYDMLSSTVEKRLLEKADRDAGLIDTPAPHDLITGIINTAPKHLNWGARRITYEIISVWFGALHALALTTSYALFDLCLHKEYVAPLREELDSEEFETFMRTTQGLPLLDSFIKESTRVNPIEALSGRREALKDFYFSDGTKVKKGSWTSIPAKAILHDDQYFPDALKFNGFRFVPKTAHVPTGVRKALQPEGPSKLTDLSPHYHNWGIGGVVCAGRFHASVAMKLTLAHILQNYDFDLVEPSANRIATWRSYVIPLDRTQVHFTSR